MGNRKPAISLAAVPGRRSKTLDFAKEIERRGYAGIYSPSNTDNMSLCTALAFETKNIPFGTSIAPIYSRTVHDYARAAAFINEVSEGRFRFGIGVSHEPMLQTLGIKGGTPLGDTRKFVEDLRAIPRAGPLPPVILASLRKKMIGLAAEIADGIVFANAALSHMKNSLNRVPDRQKESKDFFIGNMVPTCISDDVNVAKAVNRRTLSGYLRLPNYRNYWKEAGYVTEMEAIESALSTNEPQDLGQLMSDDWLADCTLFGTPKQIREKIEAWYDSGVRTLIVVPSSAKGNQFNALEELFDIFEE